MSLFRERIYRVVVFLFLIMLAPAAGAETHKRLEVVVIHSYHQDYPWTALQYEGFTSTLSRALPEYDINFSVEYLDTKRVKPSPRYLQKFQSYLQAKHDDDRPDLIYVTDDNATNFIVGAAIQSFQTTPVVFSGVNNLSLVERLDRQRMTGVFERKGIERSIRLIQQIRPGTQRIIFLGDGGLTDQAIGVRIREVSHRYAGLEIIHIGRRSQDDLLEALHTAGPGVVIMTTIGGVRDTEGRVLKLDEIMSLITGTGRMILIMEDAYLFPGVLGGYVTTARLQGETAAGLAARIVQGEAVSRLEPVTESPGELVFDWNTLQHFGLRLDDDIRDIATIINQPLPFLDRYPRLVRRALGVFVAVTVIVIGIFIFINRRKNRLIREQTTDTLTGLPNRTRLLQDTLVMSAPRFA
ncbi:MAG TPA: hypothetical protein ENI98_09910, partial [Gammaproteobacteria bacterium]|nr:hypothetical protein [Gammaproteobacteria bacterium]